MPGVSITAAHTQNHHPSAPTPLPLPRPNPLHPHFLRSMNHSHIRTPRRHTTQHSCSPRTLSIPNTPTVLHLYSLNFITQRNRNPILLHRGDKKRHSQRVRWNRHLPTFHSQQLCMPHLCSSSSSLHREPTHRNKQGPARQPMGWSTSSLTSSTKLPPPGRLCSSVQMQQSKDLADLLLRLSCRRQRSYVCSLMMKKRRKQMIQS